MLIEILDLGIKLGIYNETYFKDFLTMPMVTVSNVQKSKREAVRDTHWNTYIKNVQTDKMTESSIIDP